MGKKKKIKKTFKNMEVQTPGNNYNEDVNALSCGFDSESIQCPASKTEAMMCTEPLFFMTNSICNVPSPISVPPKVYIGCLSEAKERVDTKQNERLSSDSAFVTLSNVKSSTEFALHELICSASNLIVSVLNECIQHALDSDLFLEVPMQAFPIRDQVINYKDVFRTMNDRVRNLYLHGIDNIMCAKYEEIPIILQMYFVAPVTAATTQVFADFANMYIHEFCRLFIQLNPNSVILRRIAGLNPIINPEQIREDYRNITFAALSAMLTNYAWSFSGIAEVEVHRISIEIVQNLGYVNNVKECVFEDKKG